MKTLLLSILTLLAATLGALSLQSASAAPITAPALVDISTLYSTPAGEGLMSGSGLVLTSNGFILTDYHVIAHATTISLRLAGQQTAYKAVLVRSDPKSDLAILKVNVTAWPVTTFASTTWLRVGDAVTAQGNDAGRGTTAHFNGTLTDLNASIFAVSPWGDSTRLDGLIAFSSLAGPGDSGGALLDSSGRVIGILEAASDGTTYAIPATRALSLAATLLSSR